jgi:hypothetical protein
MALDGTMGVTPLKFTICVWMVAFALIANWAIGVLHLPYVVTFDHAGRGKNVRDTGIPVFQPCRCICLTTWLYDLLAEATGLYEKKREKALLGDAIIGNEGGLVPKSMLTPIRFSPIQGEYSGAHNFEAHWRMGGDCSISDKTAAERLLLLTRGKTRFEVGFRESGSAPSMFVEVTGFRSSQKAPIRVTKEPDTFRFPKCSDEQIAVLRRALEKAGHVASLCCQYLEQISPENPDKLYVKWFGRYDESRHRKVLQAFFDIRNTILMNEIAIECNGPECREGWFAYVKVRGRAKVFICRKFWELADSGKDSKFGSLIHDVSHEVSGAIDYAFGEYDCRSLAKYYPSKAIRNADTYQYFAETAEELRSVSGDIGQQRRPLFVE